MTINYDHDFQPQTGPNQYTMNSNEKEGKRIRKILTNYFDP